MQCTRLEKNSTASVLVQGVRSHTTKFKCPLLSAQIDIAQVTTLPLRKRMLCSPKLVMLVVPLLLVVPPVAVLVLVSVVVVVPIPFPVLHGTT